MTREEAMRRYPSSDIEHVMLSVAVGVEPLDKDSAAAGEYIACQFNILHKALAVVANYCETLDKAICRAASNG